MKAKKNKNKIRNESDKKVAFLERPLLLVLLMKMYEYNIR